MHSLSSSYLRLELQCLHTLKHVSLKEYHNSDSVLSCTAILEIMTQFYSSIAEIWLEHDTYST
jgi:hypothetical protein